MISNMKHKRLFLRSIGVFVLFFIGIVIILNVISNAVIRSQADFKLDSNPKYIVVGNSRPECAFNDSLIKGLKNLAESGENYFYTYLKIKEVLKQNSSISTVFIEFGNSNINKYSNANKFEIDDIAYRNPVFSPFMDNDDKRFLFSRNLEIKGNLLKSFPISLRRKITRLVKRDFDYTDEIGGYYSTRLNKIDSLIEKFKNIEVSPLKQEEVFEENISYLRKIISLCSKKHIKVYIIRCPIQASYPYYVNEELLMKVLKDNFFDVPFLDFANFSSNNSDFLDFTHLNYTGAQKFSVWFDILLKQGLLEKDIPQQFIQFKMEKIDVSNSEE